MGFAVADANSDLCHTDSQKKMLAPLNFDADEGQLLWEATRKASLPPLGRVLNTIFVSECREVEKALSPNDVRGQQGKGPSCRHPQ